MVCLDGFRPLRVCLLEGDSGDLPWLTARGLRAQVTVILLTLFSLLAEDVAILRLDSSVDPSIRAIYVVRTRIFVP